MLAEDVREGDFRLGTDDLIWVEARDFDVARRRPVPFVAFDEACFYRRWAFAQMDRGTLPGPLKPVLHCASIGGVLGAVRAGLGIAIVNRRYLDGTLRVVEDGFPTPPRIAYVARLAKGGATAAGRALAQAIAAAF